MNVTSIHDWIAGNITGTGHIAQNGPSAESVAAHN